MTLLVDVIHDVDCDVADVVQILKIRKVVVGAHLAQLKALVDDGLESEEQKEDVVRSRYMARLVPRNVDGQLETSFNVDVVGVPNQEEDKQSVGKSSELVMTLTESTPFVLNKIVDVFVGEDFKFVGLAY